MMKWTGRALVMAAVLLLSQVDGGIAAKAASDGDWMAKKKEMQALGEKYDSSWALYQAFKEKAGDVSMPSRDELPDWSGLWTRSVGPFAYDPDQKDPTKPPESVHLTPKYEKEFLKRLAARNRGVEYDPLSKCGTPVGFPRWFTEPFLREHVVKPHQTWLMLEQQSEIRRIYTDGRGHIPEDWATLTANGDSIGFWEGDRLIAHTKYVKAGMIQRNQPRTSDEVTGVEIWEKVDDETLQVDVWIYDPKALEKPWYTRQIYETVPQPADGKPLRISFWDCTENQNNDVTQTEDGGTTFSDFTFTEEDDQK